MEVSGQLHAPAALPPGKEPLVNKMNGHHKYHLSPIQWVLRALSPRVKRPGRETDRPPPSSAEVKNAWRYTSIPQYVFMAWSLVKYSGNLLFT
jgi:hypothetical protein